MAFLSEPFKIIYMTFDVLIKKCGLIEDKFTKIRKKYETIFENNEIKKLKQLTTEKVVNELVIQLSNCQKYMYCSLKSINNLLEIFNQTPESELDQAQAKAIEALNAEINAYNSQKIEKALYVAKII
ncbi:hypothetical protein EDEG_03910 [Edhazardia aedis USNM 41457]|uniref:Uncharacterized protein n=1 Tax=Edhazardia aedis (strain USNM 41457) TaxID=1003232 RepID=J9DFX3_EDHAE|nr:hypothetical protein EDEG_03910 [Edhazardia aedis USNM 41457]|eukprot:EJW01505.1 hypothetical protein EDEG_03910 [Edhazardia aedis USNM 41457]